MELTPYLAVWRAGKAEGKWKPKRSSLRLQHFQLVQEGQVRRQEEQVFGHPLSLTPWFFGASKAAPLLWKRIQSTRLHCCLQAAGAGNFHTQFTILRIRSKMILKTCLHFVLRGRPSDLS